MYRSVRKQLVVSILLCSILLSGCDNGWQPVKGMVQSVRSKSQVTFPEGWAYMRVSPASLLMSTYQGLKLQLIRVKEHAIEDELPRSKEMIDPNIGIEELADIMVAEARMDPMLRDIQVDTISPYVIDSKDGFRLEYRFSIESGLRYRTVLVGFVHGEHLTTISYTAPMRVYFQKSVHLYEEVLQSFKTGEGS